MPAKTIHVELEAPDHISDDHREAARRRAEEGAVLSLWEAGDLSTRESAEQLGLAYHDFLALLAERGLPVARGTFDEAAVKEAAGKLAGAA